MPDRPRIPADVAREILIEAGHRCAVCGVTSPLEKAHIVPWHETQDHRAENLICLCANCHTRVDQEHWGEYILFEYKRRPWVSRRFDRDTPSGPTSEVKLIVTVPVFSDSHKRLLVFALAAFLDIPPTQVKISAVREESIAVTVELPFQAGERLVTAFNERDVELGLFLAPFGVTAVQGLMHQEGLAMDNHGNSHQLLVVGDWVVDDNWVVGNHRMPTSTRTGHGHYRALHLLGSSVQSFCGAGRTASLLHRATRSSSRFCSIVGLGLWNPRDQNVVRRMFDPKATEGRTPFLVDKSSIDGAGSSSEPTGVELVNLGESPFIPEDSRFTARVFRFYQLTGSKIDQLHRMDWELPTPAISEDGIPVWIADSTDGDTESGQITTAENIHDWLKRKLKPHRITGIVIKDLCKGIVSRALLRALAPLYLNVPWFISTKAWWPRWFDILQDLRVNVRLVVVPQVAAQTAVRVGDVGTWITRSGIPSKEALDELQKIASKLSSSSTERCCVIALPEGLSVLGYDHGRDIADNGVVQAKAEPQPLDVSTGMASAYFSALIANLLVNERIPLLRMIEDALGFSAGWMRSEATCLKEPRKEGGRDEPIIEIGDAGGHTMARDLHAREAEHVRAIDGEKLDIGDVRPFVWSEALGEWNQAVSEIGVIRRGGKQYIELRRAMNEVDRYVCCVPRKRKEIGKLVRRIDHFLNWEPRQPLGVMLIARPGSGKTHLIRSLASTTKMRLLEFDVTQMVTKQDVLDSFDSIVTAQAQDRGRPILVFVDEINATIAGQPVYDAFLAPIEESEYVRAGKRFRFDPSVWVFVGTASPVPASPQSKASDFVSRLTCRPINLAESAGASAEERALERLEAVYLGVSLIRAIFPDVRHVAPGVLWMFHSIRPPVSVRALKNFVKSFSNIQYGRVLPQNVPRSEPPDDLDLDLNLLEKDMNAELIEVVDQPIRSHRALSVE